jgi:hypothetical protein
MLRTITTVYNSYINIGYYFTIKKKKKIEIKITLLLLLVYLETKILFNYYFIMMHCFDILLKKILCLHIFIFILYYVIGNHYLCELNIIILYFF